MIFVPSTLSEVAMRELAPPSNTKCKKCKQNVITAYVKCVKCDDYLHKSCLGLLINKGKKVISLVENLMVCEDHAAEVNETENLLFEVIQDLRNQNAVMKQEINKLKSDIEQGNIEGKNDDQPPEDLSIKISNEIKNEMYYQLSTFKNEIFANIDKKFSELNKSSESDPAGLQYNKVTPPKNDEGTYSAVTKKIKDGVILRPKNQQEVETTLKTIKEKINPEEVEVGIKQIRRIKDGGIIIGCNDKSQATKLQTVIASKLSKDFIIKKTENRKLKLKILDLPDEFSEVELKSCIAKQNPQIASVEAWKLLVTKKMKKTYFAIIEVDLKSFTEVMEQGEIFVKWSVCRVYEYVNVLRCYKCGGFNHVSAKCEAEELCLNCGESQHGVEECPIKTVGCINCIRANKSNLDLKLNISHSRYFHSCPIYVKHVHNVKQRPIEGK